MSRKINIEGDCLIRRGLGQFADLGEGVGKKEWGGVFEGGVNTPMHTMIQDLAIGIKAWAMWCGFTKFFF